MSRSLNIGPPIGCHTAVSEILFLPPAKKAEHSLCPDCSGTAFSFPGLALHPLHLKDGLRADDTEPVVRLWGFTAGTLLGFACGLLRCSPGTFSNDEWGNYNARSVPLGDMCSTPCGGSKLPFLGLLLPLPFSNTFPSENSWGTMVSFNGVWKQGIGQYKMGPRMVCTRPRSGPPEMDTARTKGDVGSSE